MARGRLRRGAPARTALAVAGSAAVVIFVVLGLRSIGWLERIELAAYDQYIRLSAEGPAQGDRLVVVEVTEEDIQALGQWPMSDGLLAQVIELIDGHGARAIGIDLYRDLPVEPGSEKLGQVLLDSPSLVAISKFGDDRSRGVPPPRVLRGTGRAAFNNIVVDIDGLVRRGLLLMDGDDGQPGYAFPLLLALYYLADEGVSLAPDPAEPELVRLGAATFPRLDADGGPYASVDAGGYQYLADFRLAPQRFPSIRLIELLAGDFEPSLFDGRIAILGVTADSSWDRFYVPFERDGSTEIAGAVLHAQLASQIVRYALAEGSPMRVLPASLESLLIGACGALAAVLALWTSSLGRFSLTAVVALPGLWAAGLAAMISDWWIPVVPASLVWVASGSVVTAYLAGQIRAERSELMHLFSRHVAKEVAEDVWKHRDEFMEGGRPQPTRLTATVLFVDMKGYTGKADSLEPGDLMLWLNAYLDLLSQDILSVGGLIDDYFGDGIMACFGLPVPRTDPEAIRLDARAAVSCARAMENSVIRLNQEWGSRGYPTIGIRVGLATGVLVAGTIGSAERLKYSIVGDVVVTAQRLESLDDSKHDFEKQPIRILVTEETQSLLGDTAETQELGSFVLKGRTQPEIVYQVVGT